jgi:TonB family protein
MVSRRTAMRVGVIQSGHLVEERVLTGRSVSLGPSAGSTLIVPSDRLSRPWRLFERRAGRYRLRLGPAMEGRIACAGQVATMAGEEGRSVLLPERARGRVALGDVIILFQIVTLPSGPRPQLPRSLQRSPVRELDRPFVALAALSLLAHLGMVLYLRGVDWPRTPDLEQVPDVFVRTVLRRPLPPAPAPVAPAAPTVRPAPVAARPRLSVEEQKRRLVAEVGRKGLLQVITALGERGAVRDLLREGSVDRLQEEAMRDLGGLAVAQEGRPLPLGAGAAGGGRVADVRGLQGQTRISAADVGGRGAERRVPLVRPEPPALDEPLAGFDAQQLARTIRGHLAEVRACYERALKRRPDIGGRLVLRFSLTPAGTVSSVEVDEDTLGDPEVTACVRNAVAAWRFAAPPRKVEVTFPFVFQPGS